MNGNEISYDGVPVPTHFFRSLCQSCKQPLGGFHIPCDGGFVLFGCAYCGAVNHFINGKDGITVRVIGYSNRIKRVQQQVAGKK